MKVEKIRIERETLDVPEGRAEYREVKLPDHSYIGDPRENMRMPEETIYRVREVSTYTGERKKYLVKVGEEDIFNDLVTIELSDVQFEIDKKVDHERREAFFQKMRHDNEISRIKNLIWYKRLFKIYK